jgi:hypothetical protein
LGTLLLERAFLFIVKRQLEVLVDLIAADTVRI